MRRRDQHDDRGLVDVELVDVAAEDMDAGGPGLQARLDLTAAPLPADAVGHARLELGPPVRTRHVARAVGLGVVAVLVGTAVAVNVADARREAQLRAALSDAPGLLEPLGLVPDVLWKIDDALPVDAAGGVVLVNDDGLVAVDGSTGEPVWSRPATRDGTAEECVGAQLGQASGVVLCSISGQGDPASTEVVVLDAQTGVVLRTVQLPGRLIDQIERDGDALTALAESDGHVSVIRWDIATGEPRWTYLSAEPSVSPDASGVSFMRWGSSEFVLGADRWLTVDLATGAATSPTVGGAGVLGWSEQVELANGTTATWRAGPDGLGAEFQGGAVTDPDGSERFALPAPVWRTDIDDGSAPGVVLVVTPESAAQLQGLDASTGETLWTGDVIVNQTLARLDGTALVREGLSVVALRIRDGHELWRVTTSTQGDIETLTDGELLVVVDSDEQGRFLVAHRLEDGQEVWRWALSAVVTPHALAGHLLVVGWSGATVTAIG